MRGGEAGVQGGWDDIRESGMTAGGNQRHCSFLKVQCWSLNGVSEQLPKTKQISATGWVGGGSGGGRRSPWSPLARCLCPAFIGSLMTRIHTVLDLDCFPYASGDVRSKSLNLQRHCVGKPSPVSKCQQSNMTTLLTRLAPDSLEMFIIHKWKHGHSHRTWLSRQVCTFWLRFGCLFNSKTPALHFLILFTLFGQFIADLLLCWTFRHVFGRTNISGNPMNLSITSRCVGNNSFRKKLCIFPPWGDSPVRNEEKSQFTVSPLGRPVLDTCFRSSSRWYPVLACPKTIPPRAAYVLLQLSPKIKGGEELNLVRSRLVSIIRPRLSSHIALLSNTLEVGVSLAVFCQPSCKWGSWVLGDGGGSLTGVSLSWAARAQQIDSPVSSPSAQIDSEHGHSANTINLSSPTPSL